MKQYDCMYLKLMERFQKTYRVSSARLQTWDYSSHGVYFVTICTRNKAPYFGTIKNTALHHSQIGLLAEKYWREIPEHFPNVDLASFVVMPNHIHGIVIINIPTTSDIDASEKRWKPKTIGVIINQFKRAVTINARKLSDEFFWQARYHDHIIRDSQSFEKIQTYIENNPYHWEADLYYY